MDSTENTDITKAIEERLAELPQVVRDAITSADIEKRMRELANTHKLHIDQWEKLENEVHLTLLDFQPAPELPANIESQLGISAEEALQLANDINTIVFEPIRQELERSLESPDAQEKQLTDAETVRKEILATEPTKVADVIQPAVLPGTPPAPKPTEKVERAPISSAYTSRQPSTERKVIEGDPYREPPK